MTDQKSPELSEKDIIQEAETEQKQFALQLQELRLKEKSEFLNFRRQWSTYLLSLVVIIVVFNALFLIAIGMKILQFDDEWLVRIIFTGSFVEVLGLAKIVVDFLFKEPPQS
jgi:hypothetical protein